MHAIFQSFPGMINEMPNDDAREAIVFAVWPTVLGEQLRERTAPLSFQNEILTVAVLNAEWKRELKEHAASIIYKLNRTLGKKLVERIELVVEKDAVELAAKRKPARLQQTAIRSTPGELNEASTAIADIELRKHFLEAAAACIEHRDAK
jgi:hypothetical protein